MTDLRGRRAVVTGASRGIGRAIAQRLGEHEVDVVPVSRTAAGMRNHISCDLTDPDSVTRAVGQLTDLGPVDILINNAGSFLLASVEDTSPDAFRDQLERNLVGPFQFMRAVLPLMRTGGHVVTVGSVVDYQVFPGNAAYAAAKHGLRALHDTVAMEYHDRLRTTLISPGATDTALWDPIDPDSRADLPDRSAMLRPDDVADVVSFVLTRPPHCNVALVRMGAR